MHDTQNMEINERIEYMESNRRSILDIDRILRLLPLAPQHAVADIGCGTGILALPLARLLSQGKVYAIDIQEKMLEKIKEKMAQQGIKNIETRLSGELEFPLEPGTMDGVLLANVLHETPNHEPFIVAVGRLVRSGGWVAVLDWKKKESAHGPPLHKRLSPRAVQKIAAGAGLQERKVISIGDNHYLIILEKA